MSNPYRTFRRTVFIIALLLVVGSVLFIYQSALAAVYYVRDEFTTAAYTNNNGSVNWAGNWTEQGDDNNPSAGEFLITGGWLRISDTDNITANEGVSRTVNLSSAATAALSFNYRNSQYLTIK